MLVSALGLVAALQADCKTDCNTTCETKCDVKCETKDCDSDCGDACRRLATNHSFLRSENPWQMATPLYASMFETNSIAGLENGDKGSFQVAVYGGRNTHAGDAWAYFSPCGHRTLHFDGEIQKPVSFSSPLALSSYYYSPVNDSALSGNDLKGALFSNYGETSNLKDLTVGITVTTPIDIQAGSIVLQNSNAVVPVTFDTTPAYANDANFAVDILNGYSTPADSATFYFDTNKDTSIIRPWNFGITFAALMEPTRLANADANGGNQQYGFITNPSFKSDICPTYHRSFVGAGLALRYHFSEDKRGFFVNMLTSVDHVRSRINLNETVVQARDEFPANIADAKAYPDLTAGVISTSGVTSGVWNAYNGYDVNEYTSTYNGTGTPWTSDATSGVHLISAAPGADKIGFPIDASAPADVTQAFQQATWKYGKIASGCTHTLTRLADIELMFGYGWDCGDCAYMTSYAGIIIPTSKRPSAEWVAAPVVGNGFHVGLMTGHVYEMLLSDGNGCGGIWKYRLDTNARYLFRNTQKRSFDLCNKEWSRYMMVWASKDAYTQAIGLNHIRGTAELTPFHDPVDGLEAFNLYGYLAKNPVKDNDGQPSRGYSAGINAFTHDVRVTPGFQFRLNNAVYYQGECLRAEFGWNMFARQQECVEFACAWDKQVAFADASYAGGVGLNSHRTIHNDAQTASANQVIQFRMPRSGTQPATISSTTSVTPATTNMVGSLLTNVINGLPESPYHVSNLISSSVGYNAAPNDVYDLFVITEDEINLDSAASPAVLTNTPYLSLGYAFEMCDRPSQFSVGGSYEFSHNNAALSQWTVWGKFDLQF